VFDDIEQYPPEVPLTRFSVACLDMAGTTVRDDNTVMEAFAAAIASRNLPVAEFNSAMKYARATMGQSKIEVFRHILGGEEAAQAANAAFEKHYAGAVAGGEISAMPGAEELFAACRSLGIKVCLSTGFAPVTRDAIVAALGWHSLVDLFLSPADAGRGRPWPDMPLTALLRLGGGSVASLAVVGDTPSDVESGLRAGAGLVVGVLSGDSARSQLEAVPAATGLPGTPLILDSVADLLPHLS
jgi:phosphoglycolate phosphatase